MKELLVRSISGLVLGIIVLFCIFFSPWTCAALLLFVVGVGTFEMARLQQMNAIPYLVVGELFTIAAYVVASLVALGVLGQKWLLLEIPFFTLPFVFALFSSQRDAKHIFAYVYGALLYLSLP